MKYLKPDLICRIRNWNDHHYHGLRASVEDGEDESDEILVHDLVVGLGAQIHHRGPDGDPRVRVVPGDNSEVRTLQIDLQLVRVFHALDQLIVTKKNEELYYIHRTAYNDQKLL